MRNLIIAVFFLALCSYTFAAKRIGVDSVTIGATPETVTDKQITFAASTSSGVVRYDIGTAKMQVSDDASDFYNIVDGLVPNSYIDDLSNVSVSGASENDCIRLAGATWTATDNCGGGAAGASSLDGLSDVNLGSLATDEVLTYTGTSWTNKAGGGGGSVTCSVTNQYVSYREDESALATNGSRCVAYKTLQFEQAGELFNYETSTTTGFRVTVDATKMVHLNCTFYNSGSALQGNIEINQLNDNTSVFTRYNTMPSAGALFNTSGSVIIGPDQYACCEANADPTSTTNIGILVTAQETICE